MSPDHAVARGGRIGRRLVPSAVVVLALLALESGVVPPAQAQWASDCLQLALAAAAALACWRAAARDRDLARRFVDLVTSPGGAAALREAGFSSCPHR